MNKGFLPLFLLLILSIILTACSGAPTATKVAPPAPTEASGQSTSVAPTGYPVPAQNVPAPTKAGDTQPEGYPAPTQSIQATQSELPVGYPVPGGGLTVIVVGGANQVLTLDVLKSLATVNVNLEGNDQPYRKLGDVLSKAGPASFTAVVVANQSISLPLNLDQVGQAYLDIQADGNIRLLVQSMPKTQWLTSVTAITVQ